MRIAVCDDEKLFRDEIKNAIYAYSNMRKLEVVVDEYECGEDLLNSAYIYGIVFLDYKMEGIDGLETARILRSKNVNCTIIFLTFFPQFVYKSFEVGTYRFFRKPLEVEKVNKALDDYFESFGNSYPLLLKIGRETICVHTSAIVFLEADNKKCYINLVNDRLHSARTMASVADLLPKAVFYKVNRAFIVNFDHVSNYDKEFIYFKNGKSVPVSRKYRAAFKEAFRDYAKGRSI